MAGIFTDYWRLVRPLPERSRYAASNTEAAQVYSNFSWYNKVMKGAASRFSKYNQYKNMDTDVFVARALDTIAEEMCPLDSTSNLQFEIMYQNESGTEVPDSVSTTLRAALRHWCDIQQFTINLFDITRNVVKYGDCFFRKTSDFKTWEFITPTDMLGVTLKNDNMTPEYYHLRTDGGDKNRPRSQVDVALIPAAGVVQFSLKSTMSENGPFGESVLWPCVKAYRHLTLLEDSVIIYRIVRAPERRVFQIDTGNMPPQRARAYLEAFKNELRQKRIPNETGGNEYLDSVHNPMGMTEDFFFSVTSGNRGSKIETLPGGENLGEIGDLTYFQNKFLQGLRIPSSYMQGGEARSLITEGKVGIAYIEELRFANYIGRLQMKLNPTFDKEFKAFLKSAGIKIEPELFKIKLIDPQNFAKYKQAEIDEKVLQNYNNVKEDTAMSARFKLKRYAMLTEDEIQENEVLKKQEVGIPDGGLGGLTEIRMLYDPAWPESQPKIKVHPGLNDFTAETAPGGEEEPTPESDEEGAAGGEEGAEGEEAAGGEGEEAQPGGESGGEEAPAGGEGGDEGGGLTDIMKEPGKEEK